ncbi:hypothetical protein CUJ83_08555 [Methanocella sp. CWC-04]|uniref:Uncharacterized protein n=1 Tax=Methanooceanicella nereidis TaxID=2052831 RepID=A0AAP2W7G8_9EURY|nr:hypothetical protein [Methanocella sp. CWC-04]
MVGFRRWNPLSTAAIALVKVDNRIIRVPIDCRQIPHILKEYPEGSNVTLKFFENKWHIVSEITSAYELQVDMVVMPFNNVKA